MDQTQQKAIEGHSGDGQQHVIGSSEPVRTAKEFARFMSAVMSDLRTGKVTPDVANAIANVGGKLLKVVEMEYRYGRTGSSQEKTLDLL